MTSGRAFTVWQALNDVRRRRLTRGQRHTASNGQSSHFHMRDITARSQTFAAATARESRRDNNFASSLVNG